MAKGGTRATNLLRISGLIFTIVGALHVLRYLRVWSTFQLTLQGSLVVGILLLCLGWACLAGSRGK